MIQLNSPFLKRKEKREAEERKRGNRAIAKRRKGAEKKESITVQGRQCLAIEFKMLM
jgi:hypothetical protein